MKRILTLLLLGLVWGQANITFAQESIENELEFVRYLRLKGWNDLAKKKVEDLILRKDPALDAAMPLELARINIAYARQLGPEQRFALFTEARKQLQDFIQKNQGKLQAALASVELARLTSYHAQALLTKAMAEDNNKSRHERARPAETMFVQAGADLEAAKKALDAAIADPANAKNVDMLKAELLQTRFDLATNIFNQARTYLDKGRSDVSEKRSGLIDKAKAAFTELRADESSEVGWLANAWLMKCAIEQTDPESSDKFYNFVMKRKEERPAQSAVRLVMFFKMQDMAPTRPDEVETIGSNPKYSAMKPLERARIIQKDGEQWLKTYAGHFKTYEGQGVLYETAMAFLMESQAEKDQKAGAAKLKKAEDYLDMLAKMEGDLSERAKFIALSIKAQRIGAATELKTFDDYVMRAKVERAKVQQANERLEKASNPAEEKKITAERKSHLKNVIAALGTAMALATPQTPLADVDEAKYMLSGAYLAAGDPYRAAIVAESLARNRPPTRRSPEGASTAIATYSALQAANAQDATLRQRLQSMAEYVLSKDLQQTWKTDPVTSLAHYHLSMSAKRENRPKEAIKHLELIDANFTDYIYTQGQLVFIAQDAMQRNISEDFTERKEQIEKEMTKAEKIADKKDREKKMKELTALKENLIKVDHAYFTKAMWDAAKRMPSVNPKETASVLTMYFFAKMELAKLMYADAMVELNARQDAKAVAKCNEMAKYVREHLAQFEQVPPGRISKENHAQIQFTMQVMLKYSDFGIAEVKFRSDPKSRFDDVIKVTENVVGDMLAKAGAGTGQIVLKDYRLTGDILGLALRSQVQKGDMAKAKAILDVLKRLTGPKKEESTDVVSLLLNDIANQIRTMVKEKNPELKTARNNYTAFLDEIAKSFDKQGWDSKSASLVGQAFVNLDQPQKAAQAFAKVKAPADLEKKVPLKAPPKETDEELKKRMQWEDDIREYWNGQVEYIRALRECKDKESQKLADKLIVRMLGHENGRFKIQAMMEKNLLLEDIQRFGGAYLEWEKFLKMPSLVKEIGANKDVQEIYFKAYFYDVRCLYKASLFDQGIKDRGKILTNAAKKIISLEFANDKVGWDIAGPMFQKFFATEEGEQLRAKYEQLKEERLKGSSLAPGDSPWHVEKTPSDGVAQFLPSPPVLRGRGAGCEGVQSDARLQNVLARQADRRAIHFFSGISLVTNLCSTPASGVGANSCAPTV